MAEYIDREALSTWLHEMMSVQTTTAGMAYVRDFWNKVLSAPAADVVEVVRCRDCQYGRVVRCGDTEFIDCAFADDEYLHERLPIDFCSYGERN